MIPALLPTTAYLTDTPGCSWRYLANARLKNGASKVEPDPVSWAGGVLAAGPVLVGAAAIVLTVAVQALRATPRTERQMRPAVLWMVLLPPRP